MSRPQADSITGCRPTAWLALTQQRHGSDSTHSAVGELILGGLELALGSVLPAAISPLIMLGTDLIGIWGSLRFINIGMSEITGNGMPYIHFVGYGGYWRLTIWRDDGSSEATGPTYLLGQRPRLAPGKGRDGSDRRTTPRSPPAKS